MQNAVMLLEQAAVKPQDLPCTGDRNVELLRDAWENLREEDESLAVLAENGRRYCVLRSEKKDRLQRQESLSFMDFIISHRFRNGL